MRKHFRTITPGLGQIEHTFMWIFQSAPLCILYYYCIPTSEFMHNLWNCPTPYGIAQQLVNTLVNSVLWLSLVRWSCSTFTRFSNNLSCFWNSLELAAEHYYISQHIIIYVHRQRQLRKLIKFSKIKTRGVEKHTKLLSYVTSPWSPSYCPITSKIDQIPTPLSISNTLLYYGVV